MHGATPESVQYKFDSMISVTQQSNAPLVVFCRAQPGPPQAPHSKEQHTSKEVDWTPGVPSSHTCATVGDDPCTNGNRAIVVKHVFRKIR